MILLSCSSSSWFYSSSSDQNIKKSNEIQTDFQIVYDHRIHVFFVIIANFQFLFTESWTPWVHWQASFGCHMQCRHAITLLESLLRVKTLVLQEDLLVRQCSDLESRFGKMKRFRSLDKTPIFQRNSIYSNSIRRISVDETWCVFSYSLQFLYTMHKSVYIYICMYVKNNHLTRLNIWP